MPRDSRRFLCFEGELGVFRVALSFAIRRDVVAIWYFPREYRKLDWRFGWLVSPTGGALFLVWNRPELVVA